MFSMSFLLWCLMCPRVFHRVLKMLTSPSVYSTYIKLPDANTPVPAEIRDSQHLYPFLKDAMGAIDGTHIHASAPSAIRARYRNRKGDISQNVLAACTFDMQFCYVLAGWEGSAADSAIYASARIKDLLIPEGKYFLADAGFAASPCLLVPYRGVRYHLREWIGTNRRCVHSTLCDLTHFVSVQKMRRRCSICVTLKLVM